jgi:hypothetical protein
MSISSYQLNPLGRMMITISKFVLLVSMLLTIFVALQFKDGKSLSTDLDKVTVHVTNNLKDLQLGIDCKDKNRDFGFQTLKVGETYTFQFKPLFVLPKSLYFCSFSWINGNHQFDIYIQTRDFDCGIECTWVIIESGPCKVIKGSKHCFHWNPNVRGGSQLDHTLNV